jgi:lipopolysaccharide/colanic/teichoic acid biosynthesis glycosyltransferase
MGERIAMSLAAHAAEGGAGPIDVLRRVEMISAGMDWAAVLPATAGSAAWRVQHAVKRLLDVVLATAALVLLSPLLVVIAGVVKLSSPGPVLYRWHVLGRHARPFVGYKFRTMVADADRLKRRYMESNEMTGPVFKLRHDPRVTGVGRWLRKYSLDELPQLWSVLKGDMSLVGPRPPSAEEFVRFEPWQWGKLAVTPGITCLWQVSGRSEISDFATWAALDLEYIRRWSLGLDLALLLRTIPAVLTARGAY